MLITFCITFNPFRSLKNEQICKYLNISENENSPNHKVVIGLQMSWRKIRLLFNLKGSHWAFRTSSSALELFYSPTNGVTPSPDHQGAVTQQHVQKCTKEERKKFKTHLLVGLGDYHCNVNITKKYILSLLLQIVSASHCVFLGGEGLTSTKE